MRSRQRGLLGLTIALVLACSSTSRAGVFRDIAFGLGEFGVTYAGDRNILSGGTDLLATTNFRGNPLDFGAGELTLTGPLSLSVSTGGRGLSQFDISLRTATNSRGSATPLSYTLDYDTGAQSASIAGSLLMDANFSLNGFGFYDLSVTYSSRQDIERDGVVATDSATSDFDLGPMNFSGNIFTDIIVAVTNPLFERSGRTNPLARFSGLAQMKQALSAQADNTLRLLAAGDDGVNNITMRDKNAYLDGRFTDMRLTSPGTIGDGSPNGSVVPEPAVILMVLLAAPAILARRFRPRR